MAKEDKSISWRKWFEMTVESDSYSERLNLEMGKEYEITFKNVEIVSADFGNGRFGLTAKFSVECDGKPYAFFPHTDLKRKLWKIQQKEKSKTLVNVTVRVKFVRKQGRAYVYEAEKV